MSKYCTATDLQNAVDKKILIDYSNDDSVNATYINMSVINYIIDKSSAFMDGYLRGGGYKLPFIPPIPLDLTDCCVKIAVYNLFDRKKRVTTEARLNYEDARNYLEQIQARVIVLSVNTNDPTVQNPAVVTIDGDKFSQSALQGYM